VDFLSTREVLVTSCSATGDGRLSALATNGRHLWEDWTTDRTVWPLLVMGPDGSRLAREALVVGRAVNARSALDRDEIKGQLVQILDAADGKVALETSASPVLDAGGNVAISPTGRRVAVLNAGAIQVFELPAPPPLPDSASQTTR
jgi:DNA-binding beta-propeller fold protein YncE